MPGWYQGYGYQGDLGKVYSAIPYRKYTGEATNISVPTFNIGDIVGCGIRAGELFFTKNGQYFGTHIYVDGKY